MTNGLQLTLQQLMADWLANDPYFVDVPIITEFSKDIASDINEALGALTGGGTNKAGICVVLVTPLAEANFADQPGPYFDKVKVVARVIENVPINQSTAGTGKRALDVAEFIHAVMRDFSSPLQNTNIVQDRPAIVMGNDPDNVTYDCLFVAHGGVSYKPSQVSDIVATINGLTVTNLHFAPAGATCYFTRDGTIPTAANTVSPPLGYGNSDSGAQLIQLAGQLFLARAVLAGYRASKILAIQF
jgi:hypothetical protein